MIVDRQWRRAARLLTRSLVSNGFCWKLAKKTIILRFLCIVDARELDTIGMVTARRHNTTSNRIANTRNNPLITTTTTINQSARHRADTADRRRSRANAGRSGGATALARRARRYALASVHLASRLDVGLLRLFSLATGTSFLWLFCWCWCLIG
jgi:hypothetical protein